MISSMDHKRAYDGNKGPNTGGMGVVAPNFYYTPEIADECMRKIFVPTIEAMKSEGRTFKGCLYFGLMLTKEGPKVIEYNCRFGDPEAEAVLPLLATDLFSIMQAVRDETLAEAVAGVKFMDGASCCVVLASGGYPGKYLTGYEITFGEAEEVPGVEIFHAGTKKEGGKFLTSGGRVLAVTAVGEDPAQARERAYDAVKCINFEGMRYRSDIGAA
jgi:phosphoribosylamine--glycine ligase